MKKFIASREVMVICILSLVASTLTHATNTAQADTGRIYFISAAGFCNDGIDNDLDGFIDYQDIIGDCVAGPQRTYGPQEICGDGIDNEGDGFADRWDTPDCRICYLYGQCPPGPVNPGDPSPFGPWDAHGQLVYESCLDGVDNDGDGIIDEGCRRALDAIEICGNNWDDNYDGRVDEPFVEEFGVPCRPF